MSISPACRRNRGGRRTHYLFDVGVNVDADVAKTEKTTFFRVRQYGCAYMHYGCFSFLFFFFCKKKKTIRKEEKIGSKWVQLRLMKVIWMLCIKTKKMSWLNDNAWIDWKNAFISWIWDFHLRSGLCCRSSVPFTDRPINAWKAIKP